MPKDVPVLLVEPGDGVRHRLTALLSAHGFAVCCQARSVHSAVPLARNGHPAVVLIGADVAGDLPATVRALRDAPGVPVVVMMDGQDDVTLADLVLAGANGAVTMDRLQDVPASLRAALAGEPALSRRLVGRLLDEYRLRDVALRAAVGPAKRLTTREREIMELLRRGLPTQQIARELGVEAVTIRTHIASALRKLHAPSRQAAVEVLYRDLPATDGQVVQERPREVRPAQDGQSQDT
jgi:DNA-binding NarL/FixJ family response regulator